MNQKNHEFLVCSFLDAAFALIQDEELENRSNIMVVRFFCLGAIDFLRQSESIDDREFYVLIARTFDRFGIGLNIPIQQYMSFISENIGSSPVMEKSMRAGADAFREFWGNNDTIAPLNLSILLRAVPDQTEIDENYDNNDIPEEYYPWVHDLSPFIRVVLSNIDKELFNKDKNREARILLALYVIGIVNYYKEAKRLTCSQHRFLAIKMLEYAGWNNEKASFFYDRAIDMHKYMPELAEDGDDSLDAGYRSARANFEDGDVRAALMAKIKSIQWEKKGWLKP